MSTSGVQQGDPLGPFFFAAALQSILAQLPADLLNNYYLDDGLHHGDLSHLDRLVGWLKPKLEDINLSLNVGKCHLFTKGDVSHLPHLSHVPVSGEGFEFLGSPIGSDEYIDAILTTKFAKAVAFCEQVGRLKDPQINLSLLQRCTGVCRVLHLLKVISPERIKPLCSLLDGKLLEAYEVSTGLNLSQQARSQAVLPTRHKGFGLRQSSRLAAPSFVTSVLRFRATGASLLGASGCTAHSLHDLADGLQHLSLRMPSTAHQAWAWASDQVSLNSTAFHEDFCSLRWWSEQLFSYDKSTLVEKASGRDRARLCCLNEFSLAWLNVCPTAANGLRLQPSEFCVLNKLYLGEPILPLNTALSCEACAESMDAFGDHLLCCRKSGFIQRHQTIVQQLWHFCNTAGFNATCEVSVSGRARHADILLSHWQGRWPCAIDVSVVHPLAPSIPCHTIKTGREAVDSMERVKHSKYDQCCNESNTTLVPFVLSTFGHFGAEAERVFHGVTGALRRRAMIDDDCCERSRCRQQLLIGLNREIARQLLQSPFELAEPSAAAASDEDIVVELEALEEQDTLTAVLLSDADNTLLNGHPVDAATLSGDMAPERPSATAHPPVDAQPPVDSEPVDILMQDAALGRVTLDCSMIETALLER